MSGFITVFVQSSSPGSGEKQLLQLITIHQLLIQFVEIYGAAAESGLQQKWWGGPAADCSRHCQVKGGSIHPFPRFFTL